MQKPSTILVTGGSGFIGSNFIRYQLDFDPGIQIVNLDKLTYAGNPENLSEYADSSRYVFERGDIADRDCVARILASREFDVIVNFAAESHVDRSILDSTPFIQTNVVGTQVLLDGCREAGIRRFVQVSTDEVYGSLGDQGAFTETTPLAPNSPYSASKAAADMLVRACGKTFGTEVVTTRCSNNYGPYQFPEKLIPLFISNALQDQPLPVYGEGTNVRDWIHVEDHCRGIDAAMRHGKPGSVYNFGGDAELRNIDLTRTLLRLLGKPDSLIRFVADRPGHDLRYAIDFTRARQELDWSPKVRFDEGLKQTIDWYLANAAWVERIRSGAYLEYYASQYSDRLK